MALETILTSSFAVNVVYPFLLVFTLVFAILQKSQILGEGKQQIDALVALAIGLIVVAFSWATDIITQLIPFLAVSVVILLVFMILYGFVSTGDGKLELDDKIKKMFLVVILIAIVVAVLVVTGQWDRVYTSVFIEGEITDWGSSLLLLAIVAGAIVIVMRKGNGSDSSKGDD